MLTTSQKIDAIESSGISLAWDGCHKIYLLGDEARVDDAVAYEYEIYPAAEIRRLIGSSCGLVFVSNWGLLDSDWNSEWTIPQGTEDIYESAGV